MVMAMSDPAAGRRSVDLAHKLNPDLHIIVRTHYVSEITELFELGANEVIPEEFETSIEIFSRVLHRYGTPRYIIEQQIAKVRQQGYEMLRSAASPAMPTNSTTINLDGASTETITLNENSPVVGKNLGELDVRSLSGATVIAVISDGQTKISPGANYKLREGDTLVLLGSPAKINRAVTLIQPETVETGFNA